MTTSIAANFSIEGRLDTSDCEIRDFDGSSDVTLVDEYLVELSETSTLTITVQSTAFDAYLFLFDSAVSCTQGAGCREENLAAANDDAIGAGPPNPLDAQIRITLSAGTYLILANQYDRAEGAYTLTTSVSR